VPQTWYGWAINSTQRIHLRSLVPERKCISIAIAIVLGRPCPPDLVWLGKNRRSQRPYAMLKAPVPSITVVKQH
jgi:hypothetical protein